MSGAKVESSPKEQSEAARTPVNKRSDSEKIRATTRTDVHHSAASGGLGELWRYRELLAILVWRDVTVRFRQTLVGIAWAILQPMLLTAVFTIVLGAMVGGDPIIPYPIYIYSGILAWNFFSSSVVGAGLSVVAAEGLIGKVYFPRLLLPLSAVAGNLIDFGVGALGLLFLTIYYRISPGWQILLFPPAMVGLAVAAFSMGTALAALNVLYRDFRHVVPFLMQVWFFCTPVVFVQMKETPLETLQGSATFLGKVRALMTLLNPINGLIDFFRAAALGTALPWLALGIALFIVSVTLVVSWRYYRRVEQSFVDVI